MLFKSRIAREMDSIIARIDMNMSNNYKDAAHEDFDELSECFEEAVQSGKMKGKEKDTYEKIVEGYRVRLKGYSHKDQKPYWT